MVQELTPELKSPRTSSTSLTTSGALPALTRNLSGLGHAAANGFVKWSTFNKPNYAAVLHGINDMRFEEFPLPATLREAHVRIEIKAVGICGSDVHYWKRGRIADFVVKEPMVIGHESAGTVVEVGPGVRDLQVGDRVAIEPGVPCWTNRASREGRYNLCPDIKFFATPPVHGSLVQYVDHPAEFCFKLPDNVSFEEGAMCEPMSVGIHACRRARIEPGKNIVILGAGPIGLMTLGAALAFGATNVTITDISPQNLDLAKQMGATNTYNHSRTAKPEEIADYLKKLLHPFGPEIIIDCVGFESTVQTAIKSCCMGGKVVVVGMGQDNMTLPMSTVGVRELDVLGCFRYANTYPLCLSLLEAKKINIEPLVTHRFGFSAEDVAKGFDTALRSAETKAIKVMFNL
jgi:L-iditol 2-dehydrogenase